MIAAFLARIALLLALFLPWAGTAHGHAAVVETEPPDGAVLATAPQRVRVVFNEPVSLISAQLLDASGRNLIAAGAAAARDAAVEITLPAALPHGTYVASYRVVSIDGHPIGGSLIFSIGEASQSPHASGASGDQAWRGAWIIVRATLDAGLLGSAGGVLFLLVVAGTGPASAGTARIVSRLAVIGLLAAALSIGVQGGLLVGGPIHGIASPSTWRIGFASAFGMSALIAFAGLVLIAAGLRVASRGGRIAALAGAITALTSFAVAGHVVTAGPRWLSVPAVTVHTSAVAFWIGSLMPLRAALSIDEPAPIVRRFSNLAAGAVTGLVVAGSVIAVLQVRGFAALVTTFYGGLLLAKLALVGGLLFLAAFNRRRLTPALARRDPGAAAALRRTISAELALVATILIATAALGTTPPPRALQSGRAHSAEHHPAQEHHAHGLSLEVTTAGLEVRLAFASAHAGPNTIEISITDGGGSAVEAKEVAFIAANPGAGIEPIRRMAVGFRPGIWEVHDLTLVPAGEWSVRVEALVSDFEKPMFEGTVELR